MADPAQTPLAKTAGEGSSGSLLAVPGSTSPPSTSPRFQVTSPDEAVSSNAEISDSKPKEDGEESPGGIKRPTARRPSRAVDPNDQKSLADFVKANDVASLVDKKKLSTKPEKERPGSSIFKRKKQSVGASSKSSLSRAETPNPTPLSAIPLPSTVQQADLAKPHKLKTDFASLESDLTSLLQKDTFLDNEAANLRDCRITQLPREDRLHKADPVTLPSDASTWPRYVLDCLAQYSTEKLYQVTMAQIATVAAPKPAPVDMRSTAPAATRPSSHKRDSSAKPPSRSKSKKDSTLTQILKSPRTKVKRASTDQPSNDERSEDVSDDEGPETPTDSKNHSRHNSVSVVPGSAVDSPETSEKQDLLTKSDDDSSSSSEDESSASKAAGSKSDDLPSPAPSASSLSSGSLVAKSDSAASLVSKSESTDSLNASPSRPGRATTPSPGSAQRYKTWTASASTGALNSEETGSDLSPSSKVSSTEDDIARVRSGSLSTSSKGLRATHSEHDDGPGSPRLSLGVHRGPSEEKEAAIKPRLANPFTDDFLSEDHNERTNNFTMFLPQNQAVKNNSLLPSASPFPSKESQKLFFLFEMGYLIYPNVQNCPVNIVMSLYDFKQREKLSEDFTLTWNSHLMPPSSSSETAAKRCLFELNAENEDIYLVARVLSIGDDAKEKEKKDKKKSDSSLATGDAQGALTMIRYPVAWGGVKLFKPGQKGLPVQIPLSPISKNTMDEEALYELLSSGEKKDKKAESSLSFNVKSVKLPLATPGVVTSFLQPAKPYNSSAHAVDPQTNSSSVIRELDSFEPDFVIHEHLFSHLYVYPAKILGFKAKAPTFLQITMKVKDNDQSGDSPGLPLIYGSSLQDKFVTEARTSVTPETRPIFFEEFKVKLPLVLTEKHHLLFTVYTYNPKKLEERNILGHVIVPLTKNDKVHLPDTWSDLALIPQSPLPGGYLITFANYVPDSKEKHPKIIQINSKIVSSLISSDQHIMDFFERKLPYQVAHHKPLAIQGLASANENELVKFSPIILNQLLRMICSDKIDLGREAFLTLLKVTQVLERHHSGKLLRSFVTFHANPLGLGTAYAKKSKKLVHENIVQWMSRFLQDRNPAMESYRLNWFFFQLIIRFMALHISEKSLESVPRPGRLADWMSEDISSILQMYFALSQNAVTEFAVIGGFVKDLFAVYDRGAVVGMVQNLLVVIDEISGRHAQSRRLTLLKILSGYYNYVAVNVPTPLVIDKGAELSAFVKAHRKKHYLASALLAEVEKVYKVVDDVYDQVQRSTVINSLKTIFAGHELDVRYQTLAQQQRVASLYFPLLFILIEDATIISGQEMKEGEKEEWLFCLLYVLRNLPTDTLRSWMQIETKKRLFGLLQLLSECLNAFSGMRQSNKELLFQIDLTILETTAQFVEVQKKDLNEDTGSSYSNFSQIFHIYLTILDQKFIEVSPFLFGPLQQLLDQCAPTFFPNEDQYRNEQNDYIELLLHQLMSLCNSTFPAMRSGGSSLIYKILKWNYKIFTNIFRVKTRATIAVSKIVGNQEINHTVFIEALENVLRYARDAKDDAQFLELVQDVLSNVKTLIQQTDLIKENASDPEMLSALYHKISLGFSPSPKLRLTWMNNLTQLHVKNDMLTEAAQCKMTVAALVLGYLRRLGHSRSLPNHFDLSFSQVAPNIAITFAEALHSDITVFANDNFTLSQLAEYLGEAVKLFDSATMFELCLEVYSLLAFIYRKERKYDDLVKVIDEEKALLARMTDSKNPPDRLVPVYFRVGFWGKKWEDGLRGKEFIYKKPTSFSLPVMKKRLEEQFKEKYKREVVVLNKNDKIDESTLDDEKLYIQLAGTKPYVSPEESRKRVSHFEQNFNINKFVFESGVAEGGKNATDDLSSQRKKKTVFLTKHPFPYVENRIEVIGMEEIILSPIENAIELINTQRAKVQAELEAVPTRVNPLQQILQGSVVPMVNIGPVKVCEIFFNPERIKAKEFSIEHVRELMQAMETFVMKCAFAIRLNKYVMEEKHAKMTELIEKSFASLESTVKSAIEAANKALDGL